MKKNILLPFLAVFGSSAYSASIDYIQNYTAEYNANPAQQGAINQSSSVYFNPAGLMRLENGLYFQIGAQVATGQEKTTFNGKSYKADLLAPVPNLALYKKVDDETYFWTFGGIAGGSELDYKNGVATIGKIAAALPGVDVSGNAKGVKQYIQSTLGVSWDLTDNFSASIAGRVVYGKRKLKAHVNVPEFIFDFNGIPIPINIGPQMVDGDRTATGGGFQLGLNYAATDRLNIGFRYDSKVKLNFKTDSTNAGSLLEAFYPDFKDGAKYRRDLPAIAALGASYKVYEDWTVFLGGNYYFNKDANIDNDVKTPNNKYKGYSYDNGWEISSGSEYWLNKKWAWLLGMNYAYTGAPKDQFRDSEFALNSFMLGTGAKYRPDESMEWVVALNNYWYLSKTVKEVRYERDIFNIGLSYTKKF